MHTDVTRLIVREDEGQIQVLLQPSGYALPESYGSPRAFASPLSDEDLEDLRWYLEDYLRAPYGTAGRRSRSSSWPGVSFSSPRSFPRAGRIRRISWRASTGPASCGWLRRRRRF